MEGGGRSGSSHEVYGFRLNANRVPILRQNSLPLVRETNIPHSAHLVNSNSSNVARAASTTDNNVLQAVESPSVSSTNAFPGADLSGSRQSSRLRVNGEGGGRVESAQSGNIGSLIGDTIGTRQLPTDNDSNNNGHNPDGNNTTGTDDLNNDIPEFLSNFVAGFVCYIPTICTVLSKYAYDHIWGIMDILLLQTFMYSVNNSLRREAIKLSQKSYTILLRDYMILLCVIVYRLMITDAPPDPFGLIIMPSHDLLTFSMTAKASVGVDSSTATPPTTPTDALTTSLPDIFNASEVSSMATSQSSNATATVTTIGIVTTLSSIIDGSQLMNTGSNLPSTSSETSMIASSTKGSPSIKQSELLTKVDESSSHVVHREQEKYSIPLEVMLYYIAVNDLVLKLITQIIKIMITGIPALFLRHKKRVSFIFRYQNIMLEASIIFKIFAK